MILIKHTKPKMIIADEGKHIRSISDVYQEAYTTEDGIYTEEHLPYYTTVIFVPDSFTEEEMYELYVEELIEE